MSIAGHISRKMLMHYTWISEQAKRIAIDAVARARGGRKGAPRKLLDTYSGLGFFRPQSLHRCGKRS
jgi:hypothetical protein